MSEGKTYYAPSGFWQDHAEVEYGGTRYSASTQPDGSVEYMKRSTRGVWYAVRPDSRDPWLRSVPKGAKRELNTQLTANHYKPNPAPSTTELIVGGVASVVLIGLGVTMAYKALNPDGANTSDTLQNTAALTAIAGVL
jgi:hypothetical protein